MKTLLEVLKLSTDYLKNKGIAEPKRQAEDLLSDLFGMSRLELYLNFERPLDQAELDKCRDRLARRGRGEPLQYIHGEVQFYNSSFLINPSVLIPRQETEILVDKIVQRLSSQDLKGKALWDVCCGSGIVGISLKKRFPELEVTLSELSPAALEMARLNAERNQVQVRLLQGDLLNPFGKEKADFFVCNPPYGSEKEFEELEREVKEYEPRQAFVAGKEGTEFYARLSRELPTYLKPQAQVFFEIGYMQGESVPNLFNTPPWKNKNVEKDWAGHSRFFFLEIE